MELVKKILEIIGQSEYKTVFFLIGYILIGTILETIGIGVIMPMINLISNDNNFQNSFILREFFDFFGQPEKIELISIFMIFLIVFSIIKTTFLAFLSFVQNGFVFRLQENLSRRLFIGYIRQSYTFHLQRNSAELVRNVIGEVQQLTGAIAALLVLTTELMVFIGIVLLLLWIEPFGSIIVITMFGLAGLIFDKYTKMHVRKWGEGRHYHEGLRMKHLHQGLYGLKDVKLFGREEEFVRAYGVHNAVAARMGKYQSILQSLPKLWLELLAITGLSVLVLSMVYQGGKTNEILPTLGVFGVAAFRLMPSINRIINTSQVVRYFLPVINTVNSELLSFSDHVQPSSHQILLKKDICINNVSFKYPNTKSYAIKDANFCIKKGDMVGFIGASGCGKTTMVDIILGFFHPLKGEVKSDNIDIHSNLREWQNLIGYIPQDIYLTDDTLRRNIAFGLSDEMVDNNAIMRAVQLAQLKDFVDTLPDGLDSVMGEDGVRLSGGQRQRIGIARALYNDPKILVLDEATSSLDIATELEVMNAIESLHGEKTIIIIAHRLTTISRCDYIYKIDKGIVSKKISVLEATTL
jgi:ATP-binding cassette, subfamily B, bacterial PglK